VISETETLLFWGQKLAIPEKRTLKRRASSRKDPSMEKEITLGWTGGASVIGRRKKILVEGGISRRETGIQGSRKGSGG